MITVSTNIDREAQTISWKLEATAGEHERHERHERHGRMCHAFDDSVLNDSLRHIMRQLGYVLVCAEEKGFPQFGFTEYWAGPTDKVV